MIMLIETRYQFGKKKAHFLAKMFVKKRGRQQDPKITALVCEIKRYFPRYE
jgi:hypothetical protein